MTFKDLSTLNAILNAISAVFLYLGFLQIKAGNVEAHRKRMLMALVASALFLVSYLVYHAQVGSVPYPHRDWTRPVYFAILIPHVILAAVNAPFILALVWFAFRGNFEKHKRLARRVWPIWIFVSISGVIVYLMLYHL